ncbi:MAG: segregation/condensation protein A [Candidatus Vogelbacteria bacterium]|nr:segregation/condensation protein A [Candidatus Vogelbacteria bacterium]
MLEEFKVKVGQFEGPLELLLDLIERHKLHINDVSLSQVTDGYLEYLKSLESFPTGDVANFIAIASTLILIKSISLLPNLTITPEEKESIGDLERRLNILRNIKEKSQFIKEKFGKQMIFFAEDKKNHYVVFTPTNELTILNFLQSIKVVIDALPKKEKLSSAVVKKVISLEDAIDSLIVRVQRDLKTSFGKLHSGVSSADPLIRKAEKVNVIVSFLAILELVKRGIVLVQQGDHFSNIDIESRNNVVPVYN